MYIYHPFTRLAVLLQLSDRERKQMRPRKIENLRGIDKRQSKPLISRGAKVASRKHPEGWHSQESQENQERNKCDRNKRKRQGLIPGMKSLEVENC